MDHTREHKDGLPFWELAPKEVKVEAGRLQVPNDHQIENQTPDEEDPLGGEKLNSALEVLCVSKAEEFRSLGYDSVTWRDVWACVTDKYKKKGTPPLHQVVNDILSLKSTQFMNWMTMRMYKDGSF
ncbi:post-transcriptional regulator [Paenibacillus sp. MBLB4367]|uniref:post-transcriptional regulator n=1 Tax=Paenibacillus sp. MBLB4367 TaxID=3384767 RepID=UPI00390803B3